jgi:hypothetical protein
MSTKEYNEDKQGASPQTLMRWFIHSSRITKTEFADILEKNFEKHIKDKGKTVYNLLHPFKYAAVGGTKELTGRFTLSAYLQTTDHISLANLQRILSKDEENLIIIPLQPSKLL